MGINENPGATPPAYTSDQEKAGDVAPPRPSLSGSSGASKRDKTHRKLKARHIQLIGIGGTIGTALFVRKYSTGVEMDQFRCRTSPTLSPVDVSSK